MLTNSITFLSIISRKAVSGIMMSLECQHYSAHSGGGFVRKYKWSERPVRLKQEVFPPVLLSLGWLTICFSLRSRCSFTELWFCLWLCLQVRTAFELGLCALTEHCNLKKRNVLMFKGYKPVKEVVSER